MDRSKAPLCRRFGILCRRLCRRFVQAVQALVQALVQAANVANPLIFLNIFALCRLCRRFLVCVRACARMGTRAHERAARAGVPARPRALAGLHRLHNTSPVGKKRWSDNNLRRFGGWFERLHSACTACTERLHNPALEA